MKGKYVKSSLNFDHNFLTKTPNDKRIFGGERVFISPHFVCLFFLKKQSLLCLIQL